MNKIVVLLSAMALAVNAYAADKLVAGTADAPNYYVLKAGRGVPYLAFSEEYINNGAGVETRLYRTTGLSEFNIWEVTPGDEEGTLHIAAFEHNYGLMNFINKDGSFYETNGIATVAKIRDIYPTYNDNGTVSLSINNVQGYETVRNDDGTSVTYYYTLDATGGSSEFCGNWIPNDLGTNWSAYKLDMTNGYEDAIAKVTEAMLQETAHKYIDQYVGSLQTYIDNVPWVAAELNAGIEELNNIEIKAGYDTIVAQIWQTTFDNANAKLATVFDGKTLAVRNMAEMNSNFKSNTLAVDTVNHKMVGLDGFSDPTATFVFKAVEGGYTLYNEATKRYLSSYNSPQYGCIPTAIADSAQVLYPVLHSFDGFSGIALPMVKNYTETTPGLNMQKRENTKVSYWSISGDAPVWSLVAADEEARVQVAIETGLAALKPYVANVPEMIAQIITPAISTLETIDASTATVTEVNELVESTLATANEALAGAMNGITLSLCNLRQDKFITVVDQEWAYSAYNDTPETSFTFKGQAEGGYILFNEAAGVYVGGTEDVMNEAGQVIETNVLVATEESEAMVVYPFLCSGGEYYGVAMAVEADPTSTTKALNTNNGKKIFHTYYASDAGSIFALVAPNTVINSIDEVNAVPVKFQGIYDLSGRKLSAPVKGINIINGKKVLVR